MLRVCFSSSSCPLITRHGCVYLSLFHHTLVLACSTGEHVTDTAGRGFPPSSAARFTHTHAALPPNLPRIVASPTHNLHLHVTLRPRHPPSSSLSIYVVIVVTLITRYYSYGLGCCVQFVFEPLPHVLIMCRVGILGASRQVVHILMTRGSSI